MSTQPVTSPRMTQRQRLAMVLCAILTWILVEPLLDDLAHGRNGGLFELAAFVIGVSVAMGMVAALRDPGGTKMTALDVARRRTFWVGVALLPVAWLAPALLG